MRKTYKCSLVALSVLASFTSCSESESLQQANLSDDKITFQPSLDNSWKPLSPSSSSRAAKDAANEEGPIVVPTSYGKPLYLHSLGQNGIYIWSKDGKRITRSGAPLEDGEQERAVQTRGAQKKNIGDYGSFGVTAIYKEGNTNVSLFQKDGNPEIAVATPSNNFWGIQDSRWPNTGEVSFHAFAPYNANVNSPLEYTQDIANGKTQIKYTASNTDVASQPDLIVATNKGSKSKEALGLNFYHALTAVTFAVDKTVAEVLGKGKQLMKVELRGIRNKGICNLSLSGTANVPSAQWSLEDDRVTYSFDFTDQNIILGQQDYALTLGDKTLMMIPQRLDNAAEVCFTVKDNVETKEYTMSLSGKTWVAGTSVIYKLSSHQVNGFGLGVINYDNSWNKFDKQDNGSYYTNYPKSTFEQYDEVGLYIVNKSNELVAENIHLIRQDVEWRRLEDTQKFPYSRDNCRYFFYYPYKKDKQKVNVNAETAEEFFKDKIDNLDITVDQSNWLKSKMADLQVGKLEILPSGYSNVTMKHQVGLVVLDMPVTSDCAMFWDDSYRYYYGDKNYKRPERNVNYTQCFDHTTMYYPSSQFVGNKAYNMGMQGSVSQINHYYRYVFVVPFNKSAEFKADKDHTKYDNKWGNSVQVSVKPTSEQPIAKAEIFCDEPSPNLKRVYFNQGDKVDEFIAPQNGEYLLECWGSEGETPNRIYCGFPGYSYGLLKGSKVNDKLWVCCGDDRGYNNGKSLGYSTYGGKWGGGGTHVAISKQGNGETYNYKYCQNELLLVAGGSGGDPGGNGKSGNGGGESGTRAEVGGFVYLSVSPGSKTAGSNMGGNQAFSVREPDFGLGGICKKKSGQGGGQGGGGFYGGGGAYVGYKGAGGSGMVNTTKIAKAQTVTLTSLSGNFYPWRPNNDDRLVGSCVISWTFKNETYTYLYIDCKY